jgi:DNA uptake protein ComE-like DNA-binding protein
MPSINLIIWALAVLLSDAPAPAAPAPAKVPEEVLPPETATAKLDLNRATSAQLQQLPGISKAWARRIIANRPYRSIADLKKAGLGPKTIAELKPLVMVVIFNKTPRPTTTTVAPRFPMRTAPKKLDLNSASLAQLQNLPGVEPGMAAHILAGRPYVTIDDLARNGVPLSTIEKIRPLVTLGP